jgi:hypothetical protein
MTKNERLDKTESTWRTEIPPNTLDSPSLPKNYSQYLPNMEQESNGNKQYKKPPTSAFILHQITISYAQIKQNISYLNP